MAANQHTHETFDRSHAVKASSERTFGLVFAVVFLIVTFSPLRTAASALPDMNWWALPIAIGLFVVALVRPSLLAPANRLWTKFGLALQRIVNPVVMAVLFFAVITPSGMIMRGMGKDPMRRKFDKDAPSYWIARKDQPATISMKNQF